MPCSQDNRGYRGGKMGASRDKDVEDALSRLKRDFLPHSIASRISVRISARLDRAGRNGAQIADLATP